MAHLTTTAVMADELGDMKTVDFDADVGKVTLCNDESQPDVEPTIRIGREPATVDEARALLNDLEDDDHFPDEAAEMARDIVAAAADYDEPENTADDSETDDQSESSDEDDGDEEPELAYVSDDGVEIYVGDEINHPGGWSYEILGTKDGILRKLDNTDDWGVAPSTAVNDIDEYGFASRAEGV